MARKPSRVSDCAPSLTAFSGQGCASTTNPSAPVATPARVREILKLADAQLLLAPASVQWYAIEIALPVRDRESVGGGIRSRR
jgi:hypothetical protein